MTSYATSAQFLQQFDRRDVADLCAESEGPSPPPATIEMNPILVAAIDQASALIRSAALIADKYRESDLDLLAASGDAFIVTFCCNLAMGQLLKRRNMQRPGDLPSVVQEANHWLAALRLGEMIFNIPANREAGNTQLGQPTLAAMLQEGLVVAKASGKFFPDFGPGH